MKQRMLSITCLLLAVMMLATACGGKIEPTSEPESTPSSSTTATSATETEATDSTTTADAGKTTAAPTASKTKATTKAAKTTTTSGVKKDWSKAKKDLYNLLYYLSYETENYAMGVHMCGGLKINEAITKFEKNTQKKPAYIDFDMNDLPYAKEADINKAFDQLVAFVKAGGFVTLSDHWVAPTKNISRVARGGANNSRVNLTHDQFYEVMTPGTELYKNFTEELDIKVKFVKRLQDAGIAAVYRPVHEANGNGWFWWCRNPGKGVSSQDTAVLFRFVRDYYESNGIKNILWEFCSAMAGDSGSALYDCYPGEDYVDILGTDWYIATHDFGAFGPFANSTMLKFGKKPYIIAEFGGDGTWNASQKPLKDTMAYIDTCVRNLYSPMSAMGFYFDLPGTKIGCTPSELALGLSDLSKYWAKVR